MSTNSRPLRARPLIDFEKIPPDTRELTQWLPIRNKEPIDINTGQLARWSQREVWHTFDYVREAIEAGRYGVDGIAFVCTPDDPYAVIDLDHVFPRGEEDAREEALDIVRMLDSYTEVSCSGNGLHIILRGKKPSGASCVWSNTWPDGRVEIYDQTKLLSITGRCLTKYRTIENRQSQLAQLVENLDNAKAATTRAEYARSFGPILQNGQSDDEIIKNIVADAGIRRLWEGDATMWEGAGSKYPSKSEADYALIGRLAQHTQDEDQIHRIASRSGLLSDKWEDRGEDYLGASIRKLLAGIPDTRGEHLTDTGNARRLTLCHGDTIRFCGPHGSWYLWDGKRWAPDRIGKIYELAKQTVQVIYSEASFHPDKSERSKIANWAMRSEAGPRLREMVKLASTDPKIAVVPEQLDRAPWLLNVSNGTLDLQTATLRPHDPNNLITKLAPVRYDSSAESERFSKFLHDVSGGDTDFVAFLQRAVGYSLTGSTEEEVFFFVHGPGASGKSTFVETMRTALGDYAVVSPFSTFIARRDDGGPRNDIARLAGARFVVASEVDRGKRLDAGLVKKVTGGETVSARFLHREFFDFWPVFKLWLVANDAPYVRSTDDALWRRMLRIPFDCVVPKNRRDPSLKRALTTDPAEQTAVLSWAVDGCTRFQKQGLRPPKCVHAATAEYRHDSDPLADFFDSECQFGPEFRHPTDLVYRRYVRWAEACGERRLSRKQFTSFAKQHPLIKDARPERYAKKTQRCLIGVVLKDHSTTEGGSEEPY